jgi:hypothetical protein
MRIVRFIIALVVFAMPLAAQERFVERDMNFSVNTPAAEWKWARVPRARLGGLEGIYVVTNPRGEQFSISISGTGRYRLDENTVYEIQSTLRRDGANQNYQISDFHYIRSTAPIFPSYTYSYTRTGKDGKVAYVDGYLAAANRIYTIQYLSDSRSSIDDFKRFVSSFQIADKFEAQRGIGGPAVSPFSSPGAMQSALGMAMAPNVTEPVRR